MCELLGMSANVPTDIRFSFAALARRGGATGPHRDGWGIAFYESRGARTFHDPAPSAHSPIAQLVRDYPIKSRVVIAHVRKANRGKVCLENTHPFMRELWGRMWTFAHNGQLRGVKHLRLMHYRPIGTTDSEHAFCWIMDQLRERWIEEPKPAQIDNAVREAFGYLQTLGVCNALLADGRTLYAHCSKRLCYLTRHAPFGKASLVDEDMEVDFAAETNPRDVVTVIASRPLTKDENWVAVEKGETLVLREGRVSATRI